MIRTIVACYVVACFFTLAGCSDSIHKEYMQDAFSNSMSTEEKEALTLATKATTDNITPHIFITPGEKIVLFFVDKAGEPKHITREMKEEDGPAIYEIKKISEDGIIVEEYIFIESKG